MNTRHIALPLICCLPLLGSCTMFQSAGTEQASINSVYSINKSSTSPDSLYQLGRYYQGQQRYEQAATAYRKALAIDPTFTPARNGLGVIHAMQGRLDEAIKEFRAAINYTPEAAHLYNNLGHALYLQGHYSDAVATLEQALILEPKNSGTLSNLNLAYAKVGNPGYQPATTLASAEPAEPLKGSALPQEETVTKAQLLTPPPLQIAPSTPSPVAQQSRLETVQLAPNLYEIRERTTPAQTAAVTAPAPVPAKQENLAQLRLEVSNGNGVTGFARNVSQYLGKQGYRTARLTNQKPFQIQTSQIQYREGFRNEAQRLKSALPGNMELVQNNKLRADIQARLLLGKDTTREVAHFNVAKPKTLVAMNTKGSNKNPKPQD